MNALKLIQDSANVPFSFENQFLRNSVISIMPIQANSSTNVDEKDGVKTTSSWFQLIAQYKSPYSSNTDTGELLTDNATVKQMKIKFPPDSVEGVSPARFKAFMDTHYVGKKSIILPTISESQSFDRANGKSTPVKNSTDILVDPKFKLLDLINEVAKESIKEVK
jgi:hypothetical protein